MSPSPFIRPRSRRARCSPSRPPSPPPFCRRARPRGWRRERRSGCHVEMTMLAVKADNLSKTYTGEGAPVTVFSNLSFELPAGTFAAIMGPSGVGKSTLLHLLGGIDRPDTGHVEIFGQAIDALSPRARARFRNEKVGFVFQFHHLLPEFTAEENVAMPHRVAGVPESSAKRMAGELLARVGLGDRRDHGARALS